MSDFLLKMKPLFGRSWGLFALFALFVACTPESERTAEAPFHFELLRQEQTGLDFRNTPELDAKLNVFNYMYFYNGGGLAAGDFNGDQLIDLYFTSNQDENRLYLNEGGMKFRDVTGAAGVAGQKGWATGATVVDINNDGLLDLYVSQVGEYLHLSGTNQLYVNQGVQDGVPVFREAAAEYGLDLVGFGTQGAFFDYDGDGDLDLYQLNHSLHQNGTFGKRSSKTEFHPLAGDRLLRNDGGRFTDVSAAAGISGTVVGYGLGVATGDLNADGWPDLYIGNDFHENDYLYLNNQDGTFREVLTEQMAHTSRFSMGVDIADINNDGHPEVFSLDMLPEDPYILKSSLGEDGFDVFRFKLGFGYNPQFSRNTLQLNNGNGTFSEIGAYAGVYASDWSWAPLFFDMDDDGHRDLFISNGIPRRMNDIDYINYKTNDADHRFRSENNFVQDDDLAWIDKMPEIKLTNKFYQNRGNLTFADRSESVTGAAVSYSSSAVYADLDNDGDLDVVTNNINDEPFVYRNTLRAEAVVGADAGAKQVEKAAYLKLRLVGQPENLQAIGATAIVFAGDERMVFENYPTRGYQSGVLGPLHLGLGDAADVDSILLVWPDRRYQRVQAEALNLTLDLRWQPALPRFDFSKISVPPPAALGVADITEKSGLNHRHVENPFVDFNRETLMPHMVSAEGPALAVGDVDGDGLEDFFIGSAKRLRSALYRQTATGDFQLLTPEAIIQDSVFEDVAASFIDLENDGDLDLIVAAGGNEYQKRQEPRKQRTYLNDGSGNFTRQDVFPEVFLTASRVLPGDFNGDGLVDFVFTGRAVPWNYGTIPPSFLLENKGDNEFLDVTDTYAPGLGTAGLITDGQWTDYDGDGDQDLLLAREWEPITIYRNENGYLKPIPIAEEKGWWKHVHAADFDGDGDVDILAGNLGENNKLQPSATEPIRMYVNDFDNNEKQEQVLTYYVKGQEIPLASHAELVKQLTSLKKDYLFAQEMAKASLETLFGREKLREARQFSINTLSSFYYERLEDGTYRSHRLPDAAQFSSLNASVRTGTQAGDPLLIGGNFLNSNIEMGWYDASFLSGLDIGANGELTIKPLLGARIGGQIRALRQIQLGSRKAYLVARNDDRLRLVVMEEAGQ